MPGAGRRRRRAGRRRSPPQDPAQVPHRAVQHGVARAGRPGPGPARGRTRRPCSGTGSGRCRGPAGSSKCTGPSRRQLRRSSDTASAGSRAQRPVGDVASSRAAPRLGIQVMRGSSTPAWSCDAPSPRRGRARRRRGARRLGTPSSHQHLGEADAGDVARRDQARQQAQPAVRAAAAGRVEHALGLESARPGPGDITTPRRVSR